MISSNASIFKEHFYPQDPWDDCIFTYIYHKHQLDILNVGKYTSPMDPSWARTYSDFESKTWNLSSEARKSRPRAHFFSFPKVRCVQCSYSFLFHMSKLTKYKRLGISEQVFKISPPCVCFFCFFSSGYVFQVGPPAPALFPNSAAVSPKVSQFPFLAPPSSVFCPPEKKTDPWLLWLGSWKDWYLFSWNVLFGCIVGLSLLLLLLLLLLFVVVVGGGGGGGDYSRYYHCYDY